MITLKPCEKLGQKEESKIIQDFSSCFASILLEGEEHKLIKYVDCPSNIAPFGSYSCILFFDSESCKKFNFTQEECFAIIAHEIGHILDETVRTDNDCVIRENNADDFVVKLGLRISMITALRKLVDSHCFTNDEKGMNARINRLNTMRSESDQT